LLRVLSAARSDEFAGWALPSIRRETEGEALQRKPFPFQLGNVLPWWKALEERKRASRLDHP
jgi:hypothetical protein